MSLNASKHTKSSKRKASQFIVHSMYFRWALLIVVTAVLTLLLHPKLVVTKHHYLLGDIAERDIKAPQDFFIEDQEATEANRQKAADEVLTVYDFDSALPAKLTERVQLAFVNIQSMFVLEEPVEDVGETQPVVKDLPKSTPVEGEPKPIVDLVWEKKAEFEEKIGIDVSDGAYKILIQNEFSGEIADNIIRVLDVIFETGVVTNKAMLLRETDRGIVLRDVVTKDERVVKNLKQFYGLDQAKTLVRIIGQPLLKNRGYTLRNLIVDFAQRLIQPNITLNRSETEERKKQVASEIKPILYQIKAGEMLLREGERVGSVQLLKLNAIQDQVKNENVVAKSLGAALIIFCLLVTTYTLYLSSLGNIVSNLNKNLLFFACILITFLLLADISSSLSDSLTPRIPDTIKSSSITFGTPMAAGSMLICLFMGFRLALPFTLVLAVCTAAILGNSFEYFIYFFISGTMAAYWIQNCRERKVFIKAGAKLGLLNILLATAIDVYVIDFSGTKILWDWAFAFLAGLGAGIVTAGLAPMVEITFNYTTDIKLLELANLDRPILRQLLIEAPGTYHHSVIVGAMVEAAATEIGANPLLAKVCGYYHDIGKIKKPLYFIENQANGKNRHDKLAPSMSSLILQSHIKDGVEIVRENKLGQVITDTIQQHHGTSLISYFYEKAKQQKGEDAIKIEDYRYPGPKPQTKEIALVMLADVVEAASRTITNPTHSRIQGLVQHLINNIFSDGQLDNCELTLKDLHNIAKSFNKILNAIYHNRIEYPDKAAANPEKANNGSTDRKSAKKDQSIVNEPAAKSAGHLKRLGQS